MSDISQFYFFPRFGETGETEFCGEESLHQGAFAQGEFFNQPRLLFNRLIPHAQHLRNLPLLRQRRNGYLIGNDMFIVYLRNG